MNTLRTTDSRSWPRDATRGGVNGPALPVQRGRESPLSIDAWTKAKARGVQTRDLQRWIDAKKRIYGFSP